MKHYPKYRKATIGDWILLGKIPVKPGSVCYVCGADRKGEQLVYYNIKTKEYAVVGRECVGVFMNNTKLPEEKHNLNPADLKRWEWGHRTCDISEKRRKEYIKKGIVV